MNPINAALKKLRQSPLTSRLLEKFGIDPMRYWLLSDLFAELSERGEMTDQLGRNGVALASAAKVYFGLSAFLSVMFVISQPQLVTYLTTFLSFTAFMLFSVLVSETGNTLVNPTEGLILAHQPINGATYTAAKLSHLARIVLYLVPGLNLVPALAGLLLKNAGWTYPILHLAAGFSVGVVAALLCCALFGWLMRYVPMRRLKAAAQLAGSLPFLSFMWLGQIRKFLTRLDVRAWLPAQPAVRWALGAVIAAAIVAAVVLGIRSLSADYLIRVSGMMRGGASAGSSARRSRIGGLVNRFFGGQPGRAGFAFVSRLVLRDWQFRRQVTPMLFPALLGLAPAFASGWPADPFSRDFAPIHLLPHSLGFLFQIICFVLPYGSDYKGGWVFQLAPSRAFDGFASGIFGFFLIEVIIIPHLILLPLFAWHWGIWHAALFLAFSIVVASMYLAVEVRLIQDIPFTKQMDPSRGTTVLLTLIVCVVVMASGVGLQYFLVFRSPVIVAMTTLGLGAAAYFTARASVRALAASFRYRLSLASAETGTLYKEIEA